MKFFPSRIFRSLTLVGTDVSQRNAETRLSDACVSDRAAALLPFGARATIPATAAAFAAIASAAAATPPSTLAAVFAFATRLATILAALERLAAFGASLLITRTAVVTAVSALTAGAVAPATTASITALALILAPGIGGMTARRWSSGLIGAPEESFQPAHEPAGLLLRLGGRRRRLVRLVRARLEFPLVTSGLEAS
jgi:hypothetical protein